MSRQFGEPTIGRGSAADSGADSEQRELQERFDTTLKGKFDLIRPDQFTSHLPGVAALTISRVEAKDGLVPLLNITAIGTDKNGRRITLDTVQLNERGTLVGRLGPRMEGITRAQILREVLDTFESAGLGAYPTYNVDIEVLPGEVEVKPTDGEKSFKGIEHLHDPRREEFLRKQDGALFMFKGSGQRGFGGMYVYVFDRFLFVDSERTDYAAFFFDLKEPIARDPAMPSPRDPKAFEGWLQQQPWFPPLRMQRTEAWKSGNAVRKFHSGDWERRMQEEIDQRRHTS